MVSYSSYYKNPSQQAQLTGKVVTAGSFQYFPDGRRVQIRSPTPYSPSSGKQSVQPVQAVKTTGSGQSQTQSVKQTASQFQSAQVPTVKKDERPLKETSEQISVGGSRQITTYDPLTDVRTETQIKPTIIGKTVGSPGFGIEEKTEVLQQGSTTTKKYKGRTGYTPLQEIGTQKSTFDKPTFGEQLYRVSERVEGASVPDFIPKDIISNVLATGAAVVSGFEELGRGRSAKKAREVSYEIASERPRTVEDVTIINTLATLELSRSLPMLYSGFKQGLLGTRRLNDIGLSVTRTFRSGDKALSVTEVSGELTGRLFTEDFSARVLTKTELGAVGRSRTLGTRGVLRLPDEVREIKDLDLSIGKITRGKTGVFEAESLKISQPATRGYGEFVRVGGKQDLGFITRERFFGVQRLRRIVEPESLSFPSLQEVFSFKRVPGESDLLNLGFSKSEASDVLGELVKAYQKQKVGGRPVPVNVENVIEEVGKSVKTKTSSPVRLRSSRGFLSYDLTGNLARDVYVPQSYRGVYDIREQVLSSRPLQSFGLREQLLVRGKDVIRERKDSLISGGRRSRDFQVNPNNIKEELKDVVGVRASLRGMIKPRGQVKPRALVSSPNIILPGLPFIPGGRSGSFLGLQKSRHDKRIKVLSFGLGKGIQTKKLVPSLSSFVFGIQGDLEQYQDELLTGLEQRPVQRRRRGGVRGKKKRKR